VFIFAPLKLLPLKSLQTRVHQFYRTIPSLWTHLSNLTHYLTVKTQWEIQLDPKINKRESYILIANHRSWFDIIAIQKAIDKVAPSPVYFMKRELLWVPILGWACWLMDFPFMNRFSKAYLEKHPEKRGLDLAATHRTCERYRHRPVTLINFIEGTRLTAKKHSLQQSPFKNLLRPRGGGMAFVLQAMGDQIQHILNATIMYEPQNNSMWAMLCGRVKKVTVRIDVISVSAELRGDYQNDPVYRERFQTWLNQLWKEKDDVLTRIHDKTS
jgi:1-acyl-sn-glycerol-3-phosphate acyltransferase